MSKIKTICTVLETAANVVIVGGAAKSLYDKATNFFSSDNEADDEDSENDNDEDENESD